MRYYWRLIRTGRLLKRYADQGTIGVTIDWHNSSGQWTKWIWSDCVNTAVSDDEFSL